jgi:hypothetical protein
MALPAKRRLVRRGDVALPGDYAIVDATEGRDSMGQVLVIVDDEPTATEIATELHRRGCRVEVMMFHPRRGLVRPPVRSRNLPEGAPVVTPTA